MGSQSRLEACPVCGRNVHFALIASHVNSHFDEPEQPTQPRAPKRPRTLGSQPTQVSSPSTPMNAGLPTQTSHPAPRPGPALSRPPPAHPPQRPQHQPGVAHAVPRAPPHATSATPSATPRPPAALPGVQAPGTAPPPPHAARQPHAGASVVSPPGPPQSAAATPQPRTPPATLSGGAQILTVGHSNRTLAGFLDVLAGAGVQGIIDVRSVPASGRFPQFKKASLERALADRGIAYEWRGQQLGGLTPGGITKQLKTDAGRRAIELLMGLVRAPAGGSGAPRGRLWALMCAEAEYTSCPQRVAIATELARRGVDVRHVRGGGAVVRHPAPLAMPRLVSKEEAAVDGAGAVPKPVGECC